MKASKTDTPGSSGETAHGRDEEFAWRTALEIMLFFSLVTIVLRILGLFPFQDVFAIALVGIPTIVLLVGWLKREPNAR